jgi:ketosteroid isomerase-like protein
MSQEAPQGKREEFEVAVRALNSRDFDTLAELLHPEVEFHSTLVGVEGEVYVGIDGLRRWARDVDATWKGLQLEVVDYREMGSEEAVVVVDNHGRARTSGVPLEARRGAVLTWRDGKLWRNVAYADPEEALEAVGLRE